MTPRAARGVPNDHQAAVKHPEANDSGLAVGLPLVLDLGSQPIEDKRSVLEVKSAIGKGPVALGRVVAYAHGISVYTLMPLGKKEGRGEVGS